MKSSKQQEGRPLAGLAAAAEAIADPAVEQWQHLEGTGPLNNRAAGEETIDLEGNETGGADSDVESDSGDLETAESSDIRPQRQSLV
jgi:hypothetical protein